MKKTFTVELIWFLCLGVIAYILTGLFFGFDLSRTKPVEIQLHDTYYVFNRYEVVVRLLLNLLFWVYLIRQLKNRFKRLSGNVVMMFVSAALIFLLSQTLAMIGGIEGYRILYLLLLLQLIHIFIVGFVGIQIGRTVGENRFF